MHVKVNLLHLRRLETINNIPYGTVILLHNLKCFIALLNNGVKSQQILIA